MNVRRVNGARKSVGEKADIMSSEHSLEIRSINARKTKKQYLPTARSSPRMKKVINFSGTPKPIQTLHFMD